MGLLVSVNEIREYMNLPQFSPPQQQTAERVISGLETRLRRYLRTPLMPETVTGERAWVDGQGYATLKVSPIGEVTAVALDSELTSGTQALDGEWKVTGTSIYVGWPYSHQHVVVDYTGGPDHSDREDMALAIMEVAARILAPRHDEGRTVTGLQVDQRDEQANPTNLPPHWTEDELAQFVEDRRSLGV